MKSRKILVWALATTALSLTIQGNCFAQVKLYQTMNSSERAKFVSDKAKVLGRQISENEYQLTPRFETEIQASLDRYVQGLDDNSIDPRTTIERAQPQAALIMTAFKARGVSPLIGLYLAWIESEFKNLSNASDSGAVGMFQFLPGTGMRLGLTPDELLDVGKSADAAARNLANSMNIFQNEKMKEMLALLAYTRGDKNVKDDLLLLGNSADRNCSICTLSTLRATSNRLSKKEPDYVAQFFAAAIFGENPQAFGLSTPPVSSFGTGN